MTATASPTPAALDAWLARRGLTPLQFEAARAFYAYHAQNGVAPTLQEWADLLGIAKVTVLDRLGGLTAKGVITRGVKYKARSYRPVWKAPARDLDELCRRYRAALEHYAEQAVDGEVARQALEDKS